MWYFRKNRAAMGEHCIPCQDGVQKSDFVTQCYSHTDYCYKTNFWLFNVKYADGQFVISYAISEFPEPNWKLRICTPVYDMHLPY